MSWFDENVLRPEVAGGVGAVLGALGAPGETLRLQLFNFIAGLGMAWYTTPWLTEIQHITSVNGRMAMAFIIGTLGMNLASKTISFVRETSPGHLISMLTGRIPPHKPDEEHK